MIIGRSSIFWISIMIAVLAFGLMLIYFIVFGDIMKSISAQLFYGGKFNSFFATRAFFVLLLGIATFPLIIKKEIQELKIASIILFIGISSFLLILTGEMIFEGNFENHDESYDEYFIVDRDLTVVKGLSMILVAFSFQQNLFPLYNGLAVQTAENCLDAVKYALWSTGIIYIMIALLGIFFFGSVIEDNILQNVSYESNWESFVLRIIFCIVLACHIPFIFFVGKESVLIIIDEMQRKSISKALEAKLLEQSSIRTESTQGLYVGGGLEFGVNDSTSTNPDINAQLEEADNTRRRQSLAYKEMPYFNYFLSTVILFGAELIFSIIIKDIGLIFEFISALAISSIAFVFPGVFYLMAEAKFASSLTALQNKSVRMQAYGFIILGILAFLFQITANIVEIIEDLEHEKS